jgi:hypothetical protein
VTIAVGDKFIGYAKELKKTCEKNGVDLDIYTEESSDDNFKQSRYMKIRAIRNAPSGYDKIAFIDADTIMMNPPNLENINGAMVEDWGHRVRKYTPKQFVQEKKDVAYERLNSILDINGIPEMKMGIGSKYGDYEWNGGVLVGAPTFLNELCDEWEKWHDIINENNEGIFVRDQISLKYAYYNIGVKKYGYISIPREYNWWVKKWGVNYDSVLIHENGLNRKRKQNVREAIEWVMNKESK